LTGNADYSIKIAHVGTPGGVSLTLSGELRNRGYDSHVFVLNQGAFFKAERVSRLDLFIKLFMANLVHFHGRWKERPFGVDPKKVVYHYHGDDLRYLRKMIPHKDGVLHFASTPDILVDGVEWLPNPIKLEGFRPNLTRNQVLSILHYPDTKFRMDSKGTPEIREKLAQFQLQQETKDRFHYEEVSTLPHDELLKKLSSCDIFIDQTRPGIYGMIAVEALALGKPVIAHPNPDWYPFDSGNPFFRIDDLKDLIMHSEMRSEKSEIGLGYIKKVHDSHIVVDKLIRRYQDVGLVP